MTRIQKVLGWFESIDYADDTDSGDGRMVPVKQKQERVNTDEISATKILFGGRDKFRTKIHYPERCSC